MIDTHCHLTSRQLLPRVGEILAEAQAMDVQGAITVATSSSDSIACLKLTHEHENLWCSAGIHPLYAEEPCHWEDIKAVAQDPKCVAWGELGLDNHYDKPPRKLQDKVLIEQLAFIESCEAEGLSKPIIVHSRHSQDDLLAVFRNTRLDPSRFVFHCFTGTADEARRLLDFGAWISFTGAVTFKKSEEIAAAARLVPADRIMVETDSPYMSPEPVRKIRPNEPQHVTHVARFLAQIRDVDPVAFGKTLDTNAERFFGIRLSPDGEAETSNQ